MSATDLRSELDDAAVYPEGVAPDRFVETHISVIAFVGERVYKVKKPVDLGFVDFTTPERRRHFCAEELRLNARISPDMYLGIAAGRRDADGRLRFGAPNPVDAVDPEADDYAVVMRRLPAHGMLAEALARGEIDAALIDRLAETLVAFHARAERGPQIDAHAAPDAVARVVLDNFDAVRDLVGDLDRDDTLLADAAVHARLEATARGVLENEREVFASRVAEGRVVDGHGDLHAGNICVDGERLWIYDCVEFEQAFRAGDVAADLGFLCMDLDLRGFRAFSADLARRYAALADDTGLASLLTFYKSYRAMVRAKVEAIVARDAGRDADARRAALDRARAHVTVAASYALPPALVLTCGLPATGKSWLAERVARALGAAVHASDLRRKQLAGLAPEQRGGAELYTPEAKRATYESLLADARRDLGRGHSVLIDGTFGEASWRRPFLDLAEELGAPIVLLEARASEATVVARLEARRHDVHAASDADLAVYRALAARWETPDEFGRARHVVADEGDTPQLVVGRLLARLARAADPL